MLPFQSGSCSLREATIVASVLIKTSIPVLHSAATMLKIAEMEYNGMNYCFPFYSLLHILEQNCFTVQVFFL